MNAPVRDEIRSRRPRAVDLTSDDQPLTGAVGYITTTRTVYGAQEENRETVRVPIFHAHPARVRVGGSVTQNLGDYNSARVEVSIDMPCLPESSEVDRVYHLLSAQVDMMIRRELQLAQGT